MLLFIAVSYNSAHDLKQLLHCFRNSDFYDWRLIVANNSYQHDGDEVANAIRGVSQAEQVDTGGNLGYFGAVRFVSRLIDFESFNWVGILNTDLIFNNDFMSNLSALKSRLYGALAPQIVDTRTGLDQNPYMVDPPTRRQILRRRLLLGNPVSAQITFFAKYARSSLASHRKFNSRSDAHPSGAAIFAPHGSAILLSQSFFSKGGSLNHPLFLFGEENHIGEECARLGLDVIYDPSIRLQHSAHSQTGHCRSWSILRYMSTAAVHYYERDRRGKES